MENLLDDKNVVSAERWQTWVAKGRRHDSAVARKVKFIAVIAVSLLLLAAALYFFAVR
jgi:hypothetical protein